MSQYKNWVEHDSFYDHLPVILEMDHVQNNRFYLFKLNHMWMKETYFTDLVRDEWKKKEEIEHESSMRRLVRKLCSPKKLVIQWEKKH